MIALNRRIERILAYYIRRFGTTDPFRIAKELGIKVFYYPLGNTVGMYKYLEHTKCIFINSDIDDEQYLKVVMANIFAANLLISEELLKSYSGYTEDQFCKCTGYPKELIRLRIENKF